MTKDDIPLTLLTLLARSSRFRLLAPAERSEPKLTPSLASVVDEAGLGPATLRPRSHAEELRNGNMQLGSLSAVVLPRGKAA